MLPLFKSLWNSMLHDELAVRRWVRGVVLSFAVSGIALADQLAAFLGTEVRSVKIAAILAGFVAGAISHGEKNPPA